MRKIAKITFVLAAILVIVAIIAGVIGFVLVEREVKRIKADPNSPKVEAFAKAPKLSTRVIDRDGRTICEIGKERRILVSFSDIPKHVLNAFIAIEDKRFWEHDGVDFKGVFAAAYNAKVRGQRARGASTFDMQLVKNRFFADRGKETKGEQMERKKVEIVTALDLEEYLRKELGGKRQAKERVVELYMNQISFGHDWFGIEEAAQKLFGKSVSDLNVLEAAALAAMPKNPPYYDPSRPPGKNKDGTPRKYNPNHGRRILVLTSMKDQKRITEEEIVAALKQYEDQLKENNLAITGNFAQDFKTLLKIAPVTIKNTHPYVGTAQNVCDMAKDYLRKKHCPGLNRKDKPAREACDEKLSDLGIVIKSSVSQKLMALVSELAENTVAMVKSRHPKHKTRPQVAVVVIDNETGEVPVLISGAPYYAGGFNFAYALRQPGSLMKAFVYAAALKYAGLTPSSMMEDTPVSIINGEPWPKNYEPDPFGTITLEHAFAESVNTIAVKLLIKAGPKNVVSLARDFGITSNLKADWSLALGTYGITPLEMAGAYSAFARGGSYIKPIIFTEIDGEKATRKPHVALSPAYADQMLQYFHSVVDIGTGRRAKGLFPDRAGGKTGTTSGHADAWFDGFTKRYTVNVWVGFEMRKSLGAGETGAKASLPLWTDTMCVLYYGKACGAVSGMSTKKMVDKEVEEEEEETLFDDDTNFVDDDDFLDMEDGDDSEPTEEPDRVEETEPQEESGKAANPSAVPQKGKQHELQDDEPFL